MIGAVVLLGAVFALVWGDDLRQRYRLFSLDRHERRWEARRPDSYDYELTQRCFCRGSGEYRVRVDHGRVVDVTFRSFMGDDRTPDPPTIDGLLAEARGLLEGRDGGGVIEYDEQYGFVQRLSYGYDPLSPDSGRSYEVVAFRPRGAGG